MFLRKSLNSDCCNNLRCHHVIFMVCKSKKTHDWILLWQNLRRERWEGIFQSTKRNNPQSAKKHWSLKTKVSQPNSHQGPSGNSVSAIGLRAILLNFIHTSQFVTKFSTSLAQLGHQKCARALLKHFIMPWWPSWHKSKYFDLSDLGIYDLLSYKMTSS